MKRLFLVAILLASAGLGCTPLGCTPRQRDAGANDSPFQEEDTGYTLAFIFDLGPKYRDRVMGKDPIALKYALDVKNTYFQDRSDSPTDRLLIAQVSSLETAVLWDGKPRTFKREFPSPEKDLKDYLSSRTGDSKGPYLYTYDSVADTFDYLLKFRGKGKTAVLVFSEMTNKSPDPAKSRKHLVDSLAAYAKSGGHCAFYWLTWDTVRELEQIGKDAGLTFGTFVPDAVRDPVRPTFLD
jgi:hypothetical protein